MHAIEAPTWELALREFLVHKEAYERPNTVRFYKVQLGQLVKWVQANDIPFNGFGKRHMDQYIGFRRANGLSDRSLHHDGRATLNFFDWCLLNDLIERNLLSGYKVPKAPRAFVYTPTDEEVTAFLVGLKNYWDPEKNPEVRFEPPTNRAFHRDRNYAFFFGLVDTGCRIGEMCSLKLQDFDAENRRLTFRDTKGKEPRTIPISREWCTVLEIWLKTRKRVTKVLENDEGWIFISEFGTRLDESRMNRTLHKAREYANLPRFSPHAIRHYTLTRLSAIDLPATQIMAGHKDIRTTAGYIDVTEKRMRDTHERAGISRGVTTSKPTVTRKRLL